MRVSPLLSDPDFFSLGDIPTLEATLTDNPVEIFTDNASDLAQSVDVFDVEANIVDLGVWLSGLRSYLASGNRLSRGIEQGDGQDLTSTEFRILHAGLRRCILLCTYILSRRNDSSALALFDRYSFSAQGLTQLSDILRESYVVNESLKHSPSLGPDQWRAWSELLGHGLEQSKTFHAIVRFAERSGMRFLPARLADLGKEGKIISPELAELVLVLPRFGIVLRWLSVIKKMLDADRPLKPSLLIFSRVNELVVDLTQYIGDRLDRFPDQDAELFATLDAASYTASIELKKVYTQELAGVASMRPTPSIFARIETAYSLLNDGFQQILAGFMRVVDPKVDVLGAFPEFRVKLEQSLVLRSDLWAALEMVKAAERTPDPEKVEAMKRSLDDFRRGSMRYLFYKDTETVERFIEEIIVTDQKKDLVPILHRFGAFLDTLFGQVALRAVLDKHPFEDPQDI